MQRRVFVTSARIHTIESFYGWHIDVLSFILPNLPIHNSLSSISRDLSKIYWKRLNICTTRVELYILVCQTQTIWVFVKLNAAVTIFNETPPPDLKPFNIILLLPSDVDSIVMRELAEFPSNSIIPAKVNVTFTPTSTCATWAPERYRPALRFTHSRGCFRALNGALP